MGRGEPFFFFLKREGGTLINHNWQLPTWGLKGLAPLLNPTSMYYSTTDF
jgi:hypothetical protein